MYLKTAQIGNLPIWCHGGDSKVENVGSKIRKWYLRLNSLIYQAKEYSKKLCVLVKSTTGLRARFLGHNTCLFAVSKVTFKYLLRLAHSSFKLDLYITRSENVACVTRTNEFKPN